jgi:hypothetical protein
MANNAGLEKLNFVTSPCHEYYCRNFRHYKQILIHAATKTKKISLVGCDVAKPCNNSSTFRTILTIPFTATPKAASVV